MRNKSNEYFKNTIDRLNDTRSKHVWNRINKMMKDKSEGFQSHRSTVRLMYRLKLCCQEVKRNKQKGAVISIDFEKAFDSVWINGLLSKLHQSGGKGKLLELIADFLKNRHLSIQMGNKNSEFFCTKIVLPQGNVISPLC